MTLAQWSKVKSDITIRNCRYGLLYVYYTHLSSKVNIFQVISTLANMTLTQLPKVKSDITIRNSRYRLLYTPKLQNPNFSSYNIVKDVVYKIPTNSKRTGGTMVHHLNKLELGCP